MTTRSINSGDQQRPQSQRRPVPTTIRNYVQKPDAARLRGLCGGVYGTADAVHEKNTQTISGLARHLDYRHKNTGSVTMNDNHDIRLARISRVSHPRATIWAAILLVVVFLGFGMWAEAHVEDVPGADTAITTAFLEAGIALLE